MPILPIVIVCHADCAQSSYLCSYFNKKNIAYKKINIINDGVPALDFSTIAGMVFMGGAYSVNAGHDRLEAEIGLIKQAIEYGTPLMGVCLGAQLISKALGADVTTSEYMETGWHSILVDTSTVPGGSALNLHESFEAFEWHEDTFALPAGAIPIFKGANLENQGYLYGNILVMQFHLEVTEEMIYEWLQRYRDCMPAPSASIQSPEQITQNITERLRRMHKVADRIYAWWLSMVALPYNSSND